MFYAPRQGRSARPTLTPMPLPHTRSPSPELDNDTSWSIIDSSSEEESNVLFEIVSVLGKRMRVTKRYWRYITTVKHPSMRGLEEIVKNVLRDPIEVRRSRRDPTIYLYYGRWMDKFICVVVKHLNEEGFIVTAYPTRRMVLGEVVWRKS